MEQLPNWLAAVVLAAGMTTVYNDEDWSARAAPAAAAEPVAELPPALS